MITPEQFNRDFSSCFRQRVPVVFFQLIPLRFLNGQALSLSVVVISFLFIGCSFYSIKKALQLRLYRGLGLRGMVRRSKRALRLFGWTSRQWRIVSMMHSDWVQCTVVFSVSLCVSSRSVSEFVSAILLVAATKWQRQQALQRHKQWRYLDSTQSGHPLRTSHLKMCTR